MFFADLHIHSRYSRATSRDGDLPHLALWARRKGIALVGTGDFTHPAWRAEMAEQLEPLPRWAVMRQVSSGLVPRTLQASAVTKRWLVPWAP